jgi:hypothetical protein
MDGLARTVREQVALGRLLPLGGPGDAAWITESAVAAALRRAADALPGVRLGSVALSLDDEAAGPRHADGGAAPFGALPYGPILLRADFAAGLGEPLPRTAERLRAALWSAARDHLGVPVHSVDLAVTGLLDAAAPPDAVRESTVVLEPDPPPAEPADTPAAHVAAAVLAVPGVLRLTRRLAGLSAGVRVRDTPPGTEGGPARRVQLQLAVAAGHHPHEVARAVRAAAASAASPSAPGPVTTAVLVTDTY